MRSLQRAIVFTRSVCDGVFVLADGVWLYMGCCCFSSPLARSGFVCVLFGNTISLISMGLVSRKVKLCFRPSAETGHRSSLGIIVPQASIGHEGNTGHISIIYHPQLAPRGIPLLTLITKVR